VRRAALALLAVLALAPGAGAGSAGPLERLGLVRFDSGIRAPEFALPDLEGRTIRVPGERDSTTLLVFWASG
jgi:hypothetical protein